MKLRLMFLVMAAALILSACNARGGGWMESSTGSGKATFGFQINCTEIDSHNIVFEGQVQYNDMPAGVSFHGTIVQPYTSSAASCDGQFLITPMVFIGDYRMEPSGQEGQFTWSIHDYGEPGPSVQDYLSVRLYEGQAYSSPWFYVNTGGIGGGNIQYDP
jgi:hypothetical protein